MSGAGFRLHVDVAGSSSATLPVFILDGIGCSGWAFRRIVPTLAHETRVALMHYRGHGRTAEPPRPWRLGIHDLADDAADVITQLGLSAPLVVGFSMGFQVALELYKRHRTLVGGLMSIAGPAGHVMDSFQGLDVAPRVLPLLRLATRLASDWTHRVWRRVVPSDWTKRFGLQTQLNLERFHPEDLDFYLSQVASMNPELFMELLSEATRHCSYDVTHRVRVPTVVLAGGQDRFVPIARMQDVASRIPGAKWVVIPEASHAMPAEYPDEIAEHILRLRRRLLADRSA